jgi:hypothetical protein
MLFVLVLNRLLLFPDPVWDDSGRNPDEDRYDGID